MGTTVECVALYIWEQMWKIWYCMYGKNVKLLVLYAREQMWNSWHYMNGNKCGIDGYLYTYLSGSDFLLQHT